MTTHSHIELIEEDADQHGHTVLTYTWAPFEGCGDQVSVSVTLYDTGNDDFDVGLEIGNGDWAGPLQMVKATQEVLERAFLPYAKEQGWAIVGA